MIFFTSDLHFSHELIIKHTQRPFYNVDEMNNTLIKKWNNKIAYNDEVYILGDFTMKGADIASTYLYSLKGKKYLIKGNHDNFIDDIRFEKSLFVDIKDYMEITYFNTCFILFHYPLLDWNGYKKGAIALHGHQHNHKDYNIKNLREGIRRYDVGVDANNMEPVSAQEIIDFFEKSTM